jgi:hypothetical protein
MASPKRRELALDVLVGLMAIVALSFVVRERLVPWIAERSVVDPGEAVGEAPALIDAQTGDSLLFRRDSHNLLLVFRSTCPTCQQTAPAWRRLSTSAEWLTTAIGLEDPEGAVTYSRVHLPATRRFRIGVVPTTLVIDRGGRLVARHAGPLEESDVEALSGRMKRLWLVLALAVLSVPAPARAAAEAAPAKCQDYCAEMAARSCDRIDSWKCTWYILGCLAGCNIASL